MLDRRLALPLNRTLPPWVLLGSTLFGLACTQSDDHAQFYDPSGFRRDGAPADQSDADGSVNGSVPRSEGGVQVGEPGSDGGSSPSPSDFPEMGSPTTFDPSQVYVHGHFEGGEATVDALAQACDDGGASAIPDWSSGGDWMTADGVTVAIPCDVEDVQIRADGSIVYGYDDYGPRAFVQERAIVDGAGISLPSKAPEAGEGADPTIDPCGGARGFASFRFHPETGAMAANCGSEMFSHPVLDPTETSKVSDIPEEFFILHLSFGDAVLLRRAGTEELAVWSDDGVVELGAAPFEYRDLAAIRAEQDGFRLLVVTGEDPPALEAWIVSSAGEIAKAGEGYPEGSNASLDASSCYERDGFSFVPSTEFNLEYSGSVGCLCALEPSGAALCIARDGDDVPVVLRFEPGTSKADVVFRSADEEPAFLLDIKGLFTGA